MPNWKDTKAQATAIHDANGTRISGKRRTEIREEQARTQTGVAEAIGTTQSDVSRWSKAS